jgi:hypothetical protein
MTRAGDSPLPSSENQSERSFAPPQIDNIARFGITRRPYQRYHGVTAILGAI